MKSVRPLLLALVSLALLALAMPAATLAEAPPTTGATDGPLVAADSETQHVTWRELSVVERLDPTTAGLGLDSDDYDSCVHDCQRTQTVLTDCHAQCSQQ